MYISPCILPRTWGITAFSHNFSKASALFFLKRVRTLYKTINTTTTTTATTTTNNNNNTSTILYVITPRWDKNTRDLASLNIIKTSLCAVHLRQYHIILTIPCVLSLIVRLHGLLLLWYRSLKITRGHRQRITTERWHWENCWRTNDIFEKCFQLARIHTRKQAHTAANNYGKRWTSPPPPPATPHPPNKPSLPLSVCFSLSLFAGWSWSVKERGLGIGGLTSVLWAHGFD